MGWFDKVFHTRGIIGDNVSITEIDSKQIGEGRGYANVSSPLHPFRAFLLRGSWNSRKSPSFFLFLSPL